MVSLNPFRWLKEILLKKNYRDSLEFVSSAKEIFNSKGTNGMDVFIDKMEEYLHDRKNLAGVKQLLLHFINFCDMYIRELPKIEAMALPAAQKSLQMAAEFMKDQSVIKSENQAIKCNIDALPIIKKMRLLLIAMHKYLQDGNMLRLNKTFEHYKKKVSDFKAVGKKYGY